MKHEPFKDQVYEIISRIDNLNDEELINELIRLNTNSREEFKKIFQRAIDKCPDERHDIISFSYHKLTLRRKPPIVSMLTYFQTIVSLIDKTHKNLFSKGDDGSYKINLTGIGIELLCIRGLIDTLVLDIKKGYGAIIDVDFNNSKELLLKKFDDFLSTELSKSSIYQKRKEIRKQSEKKLRQYLKVWQLHKIGLKFDKISIILNENVSTVKKQFYKAFEIIYGCEYSEDKFKEMTIKQSSFNLCQNCPKRPKCQNLCDEANEYANLDEKYLREKLVGDSIFNREQENYDMDSNGEIEQH